MKIEKFFIFLILIAFFVSVGGVSAQDINGTGVLSVDAVLTDTLYAEEDNGCNLDSINTTDNVKSLDYSLNSNLSCDKVEGIGSLTVNSKYNGSTVSTGLEDLDDEVSKLQNPTHANDSISYFNVSLINNRASSSIVLKDDGSVVYGRVIIDNSDFEEVSKPVGWNYSDVSIYTYQKNAKHGKKFLGLSDGGYISQIVHLTTVDYISFWYMSENKDSKIQVLLDGKLFSEYTINNAGMGKWEEVLVNVTNLTGFHTFKLLQNGSKGYLDYFNIVHNDDIWINFTLTDYSLVGDNLTLSFNDQSYGLISGWLWDFGDGNTSTLQNVTHSFKNGHYNVTLKVFNENTTEYAYYNIPISLPTIERTGQEYSCIQDAIDDASEGDTINIDNNIFYNEFLENIVIDKSLTFNFNNCTLLSDNVNPSIAVTSCASVVLNNISFGGNVSLKTDDESKLTITHSNIKGFNVVKGNLELKENNVSDYAFVIDNFNCNVTNCNFVNSSVIVKGGKSRIFNSTFTSCDVAISQTGGEVDISSNVISDNYIGVNVTGGLTNISFNIIHSNYIGLIYNCSDIVNCNNWWGLNPTYVYSDVPISCDVCQVGGVKNELTKWLVLNITQSPHLDYDYWIAGITYYNLTVDLTHNNQGEDVSKQGYLGDFTLKIFNVEYYRHVINHYYEHFDEEFILNDTIIGEYVISNGFANIMFSLNYLTSDLNELNVTVFDENYTIAVESKTVSPNISYVTPARNFDDNLTVEIICDDSEAVVFYTLDGTNPGYSKTRLIYNGPFMIYDSVTMHYTVIDKYGNFQKFLTYSLVPNIPQEVTFFKKDVFVEISSEDTCYYTLDGSQPFIGFGDAPYGDLGSNVIYYMHPFIIHDSTKIRYVEWNRSINGHYWPKGAIPITFSNFDYSVNYLKNSQVMNDSNPIWSQYQGDNYHSGLSNYSGPLTNHSSWVNQEIGASGSAAVDEKGHIYIGGNDGYLYCLNTQGLVIWRFGTTSKIICTPTIGPDGNIYFSNWMDSNMYCLSPEGELLWKHVLNDYNTATSPVFGVDNRLYVITSNDDNSTLFVFKDGVLLTETLLPFISGSTPAISTDGTLYMVSTNQELVVVNWDGSLRYAKSIFAGDLRLFETTPTSQISLSIGPDGMIYVLNGQRDNLVGTQFIIHKSSSRNTLSCFYPNGTRKWVHDYNYNVIPSQGYSFLRYFVSGTPAYYDNVLYFTSDTLTVGYDLAPITGNLIAVNATTGEFLWNWTIAHAGHTLSSPVISSSGVVYVTSSNWVYAFNLTGELIWEYEMKGIYGNPLSFSSPTVTKGNTLIVTTAQGIYAFNDIAADFTYHHVENTATTIQFTDLSTEGNNRYYWTFGDGNFSREQDPVHEYAAGGKYRVVLLVDHNGEITLARNMTIRVELYDIVAPSNVTAFINNNVTHGGVFSQTQWISLNATDELGDVTIYYTVDGSNPINSSTRRTYTGMFDIEVDTVLTMVALDSAGNYGNVTNITFEITDAFKANSTLVDEIQEMLDNAEPGSKILFDYPIIEGANFTISKPLNIISNVNTRLIGNGIQPVLTFTKSARGSIVNGFTVENVDAYGILINDTREVTVRNCIVNVTDSDGIYINDSSKINVVDTHVNGAIDGIVINQSSKVVLDKVTVRDSYNNGVWIYESTNTMLSNSLLEDNGQDQYHSKANQVLVDNSNGTSIINNTINYGFFGIHLYHYNHGVNIDRNVIYEGVGDAILLSNYYYDINITHNLIDGSFNGIDFMGYSEDVTIKQNTIMNLHEHKGDLDHNQYISYEEEWAMYMYEEYFGPDMFYKHRNNGIQVSFPASNFDEGNTIIIDNVVIKLGHRAWESRKYQGYLDVGCAGYGYNMMDGSNSYTGQGGATSYHEGKVDMVVDRIGDATFRLRLINRLDGHYLTEIPAFDVIFNSNGFVQTVKFNGSEAIAEFDVSMVLTDIDVIISTEIRKSAHFDMEITEGFSGSNRAFDPGLERGEAWDNPDPVVPKFPEPEDDYKPTDPIVNPPISEPETGYGNGTGNGQGTGNGTGTGDGDGNGSSGNFGTGKSNIFGELNKLSGQKAEFTGIGDVSSSEDVSDDSTDGMDRSSEGGSDAGSGETVHAYEVSKVINVDESNWKFVVAVVLFSCIVLLGYAYRKRRGDGDEI